MIALFDCVSDALKFRRWMIELAGDLDLQFGMARDRIIIDRDPAIGRDEFAIFGQDEWINFERPGLDAARSGK